MSDQSAHDLRTSYDAVADDYTARIAAELQHKPFDRLLLDQYAEQVRDLGVVADIGCGPGHVARHLQKSFISTSGGAMGSRSTSCSFAPTRSRCISRPQASKSSGPRNVTRIRLRLSTRAGVATSLRGPLAEPQSVRRQKEGAHVSIAGSAQGLGAPLL